MKEISSKTLTLLVALAVVVSIMGTLVTLKRFADFDDITGRLATTDLGTVSVEVASAAYINVTDNLINFQNMTVGTSNESEFLASGADFIVVRNDGSITINITAYLSSNESLFSSTDNVGCPGSDTGVSGTSDKRCVFVRCYNATTAGSCNSNYKQINESITSPHLNLTTGLAIGGTANISVNLTVPSNEGAGLKSGTLVMVGSSTA